MEVYAIMLSHIFTLEANIQTKQYICSAQSRNRYNSGIAPAQSRNSHFVGQSKNSYFAQFNSGIVRAQSRNRDKVRIFNNPCAK